MWTHSVKINYDISCLTYNVVCEKYDIVIPERYRQYEPKVSDVQLLQYCILYDFLVGYYVVRRWYIFVGQPRILAQPMMLHVECCTYNFVQAIWHTTWYMWHMILKWLTCYIVGDLWYSMWQESRHVGDGADTAAYYYYSSAANIITSALAGMDWSCTLWNQSGPAEH